MHRGTLRLSRHPDVHSPHTPGVFWPFFALLCASRPHPRVSSTLPLAPPYLPPIISIFCWFAGARVCATLGSRADRRGWKKKKSLRRRKGEAQPGTNTTQLASNGTKRGKRNRGPSTYAIDHRPLTIDNSATGSQLGCGSLLPVTSRSVCLCEWCRWCLWCLWRVSFLSCIRRLPLPLPHSTKLSLPKIASKPGQVSFSRVVHPQVSLLTPPDSRI